MVDLVGIEPTTSSMPSGGLLNLKNLQDLRELPNTCKYLKIRRSQNDLGLKLGLEMFGFSINKSVRNVKFFSNKT